jgi:hypothetical protein
MTAFAQADSKFAARAHKVRFVMRHLRPVSLKMPGLSGSNQPFNPNDFRFETHLDFGNGLYRCQKVTSKPPATINAPPTST